MAIPIEAYTSEGVLTGVVDAPGRLRDVLETSESVRLAPIHGEALDGRILDAPVEDVLVDALLMVVPDDVDVPVHAVWHDIRLTVGPYRLDGELPTMPGFDPGRALARPSGTFVLLREVTVSVPADDDVVVGRHARLLVNRYEVETVAAAMVLGFFFPGAQQELREPAAADSFIRFATSADDDGRPTDEDEDGPLDDDDPSADVAAGGPGAPAGTDATDEVATAGEAWPVADRPQERTSVA